MAIDGVKTVKVAYQRNELPEPSAKQIVDFETGAAKVQREADQTSIPEQVIAENPTKNPAKSSIRNPMEQTEAKEQQNKDSVKRAVEEINRKASSSEAVFGIHEETNRVTIKIVDKDSKKVIKEVPPEKTLDMIAKVWEIAGLLVDEKG